MADRAGGGEKLFGRLILAVWQDKSMPSNSFYFFSKEKNTLCCDSKGLFLQKKENQFLEMPALHLLTMWLEIWNWNIMVTIFIRTHLGMCAGKRMWWTHKASLLHSHFRNQTSVWVTNIAQHITLVSIIGTWTEVRQLLSEMARQGQTDLFQRGRISYGLSNIFISPHI